MFITWIKYILLQSYTCLALYELGERMRSIENRVSQLETGVAQSYKNLGIVQLTGSNSGLDYLTLDEAVNSGLQITETGSVPVLHFRNKSGKDVLIMQGEYVTGGKQNRMIASNIYMQNGFDGDVAVRCIEAGRWHPRTDNGIGPSIIHGQFRSGERMVTREVSYAAAMGGQGEVWNRVSATIGGLGVNARDSNFDDIHSQRKEDIDRYLSKFSYEANSVGIIAIIDKNGSRKYSVDIFDQGRTLKKNFRKIVESYAVEALAGKGNLGKVTRTGVNGFLEEINSCDFTQRDTVGHGIDLLIGGSVGGSVLTYKNAPLYISFYTKGDSKPEKKNDDDIFGGQRPVRIGLLDRLRGRC